MGYLPRKRPSHFQDDFYRLRIELCEDTSMEGPLYRRCKEGPHELLVEIFNPWRVNPWIYKLMDAFGEGVGRVPSWMFPPIMWICPFPSEYATSNGHHQLGPGNQSFFQKQKFPWQYFCLIYNLSKSHTRSELTDNKTPASWGKNEKVGLSKDDHVRPPGGNVFLSEDLPNIPPASKANSNQNILSRSCFKKELIYRFHLNPSCWRISTKGEEDLYRIHEVRYLFSGKNSRKGKEYV